VFQAVEQALREPGSDAVSFELSGFPQDLETLFDFAYRRGARVHNNSWTDQNRRGSYNESSRRVDSFVWRHPDFCIVVAAGNQGRDRSGPRERPDGRVDPGSVEPPGTAKNCITVGASESLRPGHPDQTYGQRWPDDYPRQPLRGDGLADNPDSVAAFSGRGPTKDGRFKPDLVAPGTLIVSTRSSLTSMPDTSEPTFEPDPEHYTSMSGTSMAAPIVAGCAALLRQALRRDHGHANPSAALVKALLIAGCVRLPSRHAGLVDHEQGFGRIDLRRSLRRVLSVVDAPGLGTGQSHELTLPVPRARQATLRVVLAYSDAPGPRLVNNLNLFVRAPSGRLHLGNTAARAGFALDSRNNVECVQVVRAEAGDWKIGVIGSNVPQGPQDFALAAVLV
jgi:serine protease AprX